MADSIRVKAEKRDRTRRWRKESKERNLAAIRAHDPAMLERPSGYHMGKCVACWTVYFWAPSKYRKLKDTRCPIHYWPLGQTRITSHMVFEPLDNPEAMITEHCDNVSCPGFPIRQGAEFWRALIDIYQDEASIKVCSVCEDSMVSSGDWHIHPVRAMTRRAYANIGEEEVRYI